MKTQMKCCIMQHFIRVYTVCSKIKIIFRERNTILFVTPPYIQWTIPSLLYQARKKNPLVHKRSKVAPVYLPFFPSADPASVQPVSVSAHTLKNENHTKIRSFCLESGNICKNNYHIYPSLKLNKSLLELCKDK